MSPLPNTAVIGPGWSAHNRPVADATMTCLATLTRPAADASLTFDRDTGTSTATAITLATDVRARIQQQNDAQTPVTGGQQVPSRRYLVVLPFDTAIVRAGDQITITSGDDNLDPTLLDRTLTVVSVEHGSLAWEQDLICTDPEEPQS